VYIARVRLCEKYTFKVLMFMAVYDIVFWLNSIP